jgi:hypothetical protein
MYQKISTLNSKTWFTGLTAFLDKLRHRYCFVACRKGVVSKDVLDGMAMKGLTKRSEWDFKMVSMR